MNNIIQTIDKKMLMERIIRVRTNIIKRYPFYGELILHLKVAFANVGTACTDMTRILYDPVWISRLDDMELTFLTMHEVMHCVLAHPVRGKSKLNYLYNIAADIVVNSHILHEMQLPLDYKVDDKIPMHLSADGKEGRFQTAEEVYLKLLNAADGNAEGNIEHFGGGLLDRHDIWRTVSENSMVLKDWKESIKIACQKVGENNFPAYVRKIDFDEEEKASVNWRSVLKNYLQRKFDSFDYSYMRPDRRFTLNKFILPGFTKAESENNISKVLVMIDTSASMSDKALGKAYSEIRYLIEEFGGTVRGELAFFDNRVSKVTKFISVDELLEIKPVGGCGTSFKVVFDFLSDNYRDSNEWEYTYGEEEDNNKRPDVVIIITDGCAELPLEEDVDLDMSILWILLETKIRKMDWGNSIYIDD